MSREALQQVLDQINSLDPEELEQVNEAVQHRLAPQDPEHNRQSFHKALVESGLCLSVHERKRVTNDECPLIKIEGEPLSQTIIRERR